MRRNPFITLEGGEGAGKSTQTGAIKDWLEQRGHRVVVTREPGGTAIGEKIRGLLLHNSEAIHVDTEILLMFAARAEHLARVVRPALSNGETVLCDRFTDATYAYQGGGRGAPVERIAAIESWLQQELRPDITLLLDLPIDTGLQRVRSRGAPDRFEREQHAFFERVRAAYLAQAKREPNRMKIVDASRGEAEVTHEIIVILENLIHG